MNNNIINRCNNLLNILESKLTNCTDNSTVSVNQCIQQDIDTDNIITNEQINDDIVIIQGFHGNDIGRVAATTQAIQKLLSMNPIPKWIFVEAQTSKSNCVFQWLGNLGIKYKFVKVTKKSDGLFLKPSLWNIGVGMTSCTKLIFLDSDIYFKETDWVCHVYNALTKYDVISPHGFSSYTEQCIDVSESIGHSIMNSHKHGHIGFSLGMTRYAYDVLGGFKPCSFRHSDNVVWEQILGTNVKNKSIGWSPYVQTGSCDEINGLPFSIGSTECTCLHISHGSFRNRNYEKNALATWYGVKEPYSEMTINSDGIPEWSDSHIGRIMCEVRKHIDDKDTEITDIIQNIYLEECGEIDDDSPLFIISHFRPSYDCNMDQLHKHYMSMMQKCHNDFTYICALDCDDNLFELYKNRIQDILSCDNIDIIHIKEDLLKFVQSKNMKFPKNSNILICDVNIIPDIDFSLVRCPKCECMSIGYTKLNNFEKYTYIGV